MPLLFALFVLVEGAEYRITQEHMERVDEDPWVPCEQQGPRGALEHERVAERPPVEGANLDDPKARLGNATGKCRGRIVLQQRRQQPLGV